MPGTKTILMGLLLAASCNQPENDAPPGTREFCLWFDHQAGCEAEEGCYWTPITTVPKGTCDCMDAGSRCEPGKEIGDGDIYDTEYRDAGEAWEMSAAEDVFGVELTGDWNLCASAPEPPAACDCPCAPK